MTDDDAGSSADGATRRPGGWRTVVAELDARTRRAHERTVARLQVLEKRMVEASHVLAEALPRIEGLAGGLAEVRGRVDAELATGSSTPFTPVHWPSLSADEAEAAWNDLGRWIADVLGPWYGLTRGQLPDCWPLHRRAVVELSWLRTSYLVAYSSKASASMAAEWHSRWLKEALAGVAKGIPTNLCRPGAHLRAHEGNDYVPRAPGGEGPRSPGRTFVDPRVEVSRRQHWWPAFERALVQDVQARQRSNPVSAEGLSERSSAEPR